MEEGDFNTLVQTCTGRPMVQRFLSAVTDQVSARGGDMDIGRKCESILKSLEAFERVHVDTLTVAFNESNPGK